MHIPLPMIDRCGLVVCVRRWTVVTLEHGLCPLSGDRIVRLLTKIKHAKYYLCILVRIATYTQCVPGDEN